MTKDIYKCPNCGQIHIEYFPYNQYVYINCSTCGRHMKLVQRDMWFDQYDRWLYG